MPRNRTEFKKDSPLEIACEDGQLIIRIGVDTLAHAAQRSDSYNAYDPAISDWNLKWRIRDNAAFANVIAHVLRNEDAEDGSSPFTRLLDQIFIKAAEDCDSSVEEIELPSTEQKGTE